MFGRISPITRVRCGSVDCEDLRGLKPSSFATWMMWRRVSGETPPLPLRT